MKVFVATKSKQGKRKNDFSHTKEGELVKFGFECDGESVDGKCGCKRSMVGVDTLKATTTFAVKDINIKVEEYIKKLLDSERKGGWLNKESSKDTIKAMEDAAKYLLELANGFAVGAILEKRGDKIQVR